MNAEETKTATKALAVMFTAFPQSPAVDVDAQLRGYIHAVKDYEIADLLEAIRRYVQGEVPNANAAFCPSTARLCQEVRGRCEIRLLKERRSNVVSLPPRSTPIGQSKQG